MERSNQTHLRRVAALAGVSYLKDLPPAERDALAAACEFRDVPRGSLAFAEGDAATGVFLIVSGRIRLMRTAPDGREQVLHEEGPGASLAEVPAFDGQGYVGSAIAVEDSVVLFVPRRPLLAALDRNPGSARELIRILATRVRRFAALVEDLSLRTVTERLAGYLLRESERTGCRTLELPATREELAAHVGTVREQVSRALSELKRAGLIELEGRRVHVVDRSGLSGRAGWP